MAGTSSSSPRPEVLIAGGGFGAVEAMLALRALAGEDVQVTLISPQLEFAYRPAATMDAFHETPPQTYDLQAIAAEAGASFRVERLQAVAPQQKHVRLASFAYLDYDALILAIGARAVAGIPGALTFSGQHDIPQFRRVLDELRAEDIHRIVFATPAGCAWPLPLYELALLTAAYAEAHKVRADIALVSPEMVPLEVFGTEASSLVADVLAERGVRFLSRSIPTSFQGDGGLSLHTGAKIDADRVIAAPALYGPRITGVPTDRSGFVLANAFGCVEGLSDVYAVGDMTTFPIKQGGIATQQADVVAQAVARGYGAPVKEARPERVLRARLVGGKHPIFLRTELDEYGQATTAALEHVEVDQPAAPAGKVFGRYLTPFLQTRESLLQP